MSSKLGRELPVRFRLQHSQPALLHRHSLRGPQRGLSIATGEHKRASGENSTSNGPQVIDPVRL
jgi:hypothetical protein